MKKFNLLLTSLTVGLIFLFTGLAAEAATFTNKDGVLKVTLQNGPKFTPANSMNIKIEFDLSGLSVQPGNTLEITYPDSIEGWGDPHFTFYDENKDLMATGVSQNGKIIITFTDIVKDKTDIKGFFDMKFKPTPNKMPLGKNTLAFESKNGLIPIDIELIQSLKDMSKKGSIKELAPGEKGIRWTMVVNRNELWMEKLLLKDVITDPELTYIPGSLRVSEGIWTYEVRTSYKRLRQLTPSLDFSLTELVDGVNVLFPAGDKMYVVDLDTSVKEPSKLEVLGHSFKNEASLSWINENGAKEALSVGANLVVKGNNSGIGGNNVSPNSSDSSSSDIDEATSSPTVPPGSTGSTHESSTSTDSSTIATHESSTIEESIESETITEHSSNESGTTAESSSFDSSTTSPSVPNGHSTESTANNSTISTTSTSCHSQWISTEKDAAINSTEKSKNHLASTGESQRKVWLVSGITALLAAFAILGKQKK